MRGSLGMALTIDVLGPLSACGVAERAQRGERSRVRIVVPDSGDPTCKDNCKPAVTSTSCPRPGRGPYQARRSKCLSSMVVAWCGQRTLRGCRRIL